MAAARRRASRGAALRGAALLGCLATAAATQGVPKEVVESALVFGGTSTMGLKNNNDAAQCLRAAIVAVLREEYSAAFVSLPEASAYVEGGETDTKVSFTVSADGMDAVLVRNDLAGAVVESSAGSDTLMGALGDCWPFDDIDADASAHVLQTETYRRASFADVGATVSSAVVLTNVRASVFNADAVAVTQFGLVIADVLRAATIQIDNVVAEEYTPPSIQDDDDPAVPSIDDDDYTESLTTTVRFDVAIHYWPLDATVLETSEAIAQALKDALLFPVGTTAMAVALASYGKGDRMRSATLDVGKSQLKIDEVTMDGSHAVTSPPVPCTANCGGGGSGSDDDDDGLDEAAAAAVALVVILAVLGLLGLVCWLHRSNKLRECCPSEEVEASAGELELDKVSSATAEPSTEMV